VGTRKHFANGAQSLTFAGGATTVTVDATVTNLQKIVTNRAATTAAQATAGDTVKAERAQAPALNAFMDAFEEFVRLNFEADTNALADFGLKPRKAPRPQTAETKAAAAAKRTATRKAHEVQASATAPAAPPAGATSAQPKG
jgi:hypothetical protein